MLKAVAFINGGLVAIVFSSLLLAQRTESSTENGGPSPLPLASIVRYMEHAEAKLANQTPYQVVREYRLFSGSNPEPTSQVLAVVNFRSAEGKDYRIEEQSGSNRGEQVVKRILDNEVKESTQPRSQASALTEDNYTFGYVSETVLNGHPSYLLSLTPKRKDAHLLSGHAWVDKGSFLVRHVEGEMVKTPSWWLRKVSIKITFNDVQGIWTQSDVEALADVRLVGQQTLLSQAVRCQTLDMVAARKRSLTAIQNSRTKRQINHIPAEAMFDLNHK